MRGLYIERVNPLFNWYTVTRVDLREPLFVDVPEIARILGLRYSPAFIVKRPFSSSFHQDQHHTDKVLHDGNMFSSPMVMGWARTSKYRNDNSITNPELPYRIFYSSLSYGGLAYQVDRLPSEHEDPIADVLVKIIPGFPMDLTESERRELKRGWDWQQEMIKSDPEERESNVKAHENWIEIASGWPPPPEPWGDWLTRKSQDLLASTKQFSPTDWTRRSIFGWRQIATIDLDSRQVTERWVDHSGETKASKTKPLEL